VIQSDILKHEFETNRKLYEDLLQKQKEVSISSSLKSSNIWDCRSSKTAETAHRAEYSAEPSRFLSCSGCSVACYWRSGLTKANDKIIICGAGRYCVAAAFARCRAVAGSKEQEMPRPPNSMTSTAA